VLLYLGDIRADNVFIAAKHAERLILKRKKMVKT